MLTKKERKDTIMEKGKLGNAIRQSRIENKLTQEELAELVGITPTHLKHIESEHRKPSIDVLFKFATQLHLSLDSLLFTTNETGDRLQQYNEIQFLLQDCSSRELRAILAALRELVKKP